MSGPQVWSSDVLALQAAVDVGCQLPEGQAILAAAQQGLARHRRLRKGETLDGDAHPVEPIVENARPERGVRELAGHRRLEHCIDRGNAREARQALGRRVGGEHVRVFGEHGGQCCRVHRLLPAAVIARVTLEQGSAAGEGEREAIERARADALRRKRVGEVDDGRRMRRANRSQVGRPALTQRAALEERVQLLGGHADAFEPGLRVGRRDQIARVAEVGEQFVGDFAGLLAGGVRMRRAREPLPQRRFEGRPVAAPHGGEHHIEPEGPRGSRR